jgi:PAS domain S-box-containing protein
MTKAHAAIRATDRRLDALVVALELFTGPAAVYEADGTLIAINGAAVSMSNYDPTQLVGTHFGDFMPSEIRDRARTQFERCVEQGEPGEFETLVVIASGKATAMRLRLLPLSEDGRVVGVLVVAYEAKEELVFNHLRFPSLTRRQHEILTLLASAQSTTEIADRLGLATETVRNHVRALLRELNAHSRLEAVVTAERLGLLPPLPFRAA